MALEDNFLSFMYTFFSLPYSYMALLFLIVLGTFISEDLLCMVIGFMVASYKIKYIPAVTKLNNIVKSGRSIQEKLAAIISLGEIGEKSSLDILIKSLDDEEANIRWDSAISLYKMNNNSGVHIIKKLLNRKYYLNYPNVDINETSNTILTVLALISSRPLSDFKDQLQILSQKEENIKIREFSMKILVEHY